MAISAGDAFVVAFCYGFIIVTGSFSNGLIAYTYFKWNRRILTQPKDVLILSLAIGDFVMSSFVSPLGFASGVSRRWTAGYAGCVYYGFLSTWVGLASIVQLAIHAIERYITLSSPTPKVITVKRSFQIVIVAWLVTLLASSLPLMGWSEYTFEGFGLHCSILWGSSSMIDTSYSLFLLVFFFLFPMIAISFSYVKIFVIVRRIYLNADTLWGPEARATKETYKAQVKTAKQLLLMIGGFLFAWTPYAIVSTVVVFFGAEVPIRYHQYPSLFAKTAIVYNPIIYFFTYRSLREKAMSLLRYRRSPNTIEPAATSAGYQSRFQHTINQTSTINNANE